MTDCFVCAKHARGEGVAGGIVHRDDLVTADHMPPDPDAYLGYLSAEPRRHVAGIGQLTDEEAAALGVLVNDLGRRLREAAGAEHVYTFVLGDAVPHLHVHIVPRYPGTPREHWGTRLAEWPDAPRGGIPEITELCDRLRASGATP